MRWLQDPRNLGKQNWIFSLAHLLQTEICVFWNTAKDCQVHSGKLLQPELQISQLRQYIDHKNENHFEVALSALRPSNNDMNNKSDTAESLMTNLAERELFGRSILILQKPMHSENKTKIQTLRHSINRKVNRNSNTESEDTKMYWKKKKKN